MSKKNEWLSTHTDINDQFADLLIHLEFVKKLLKKTMTIEHDHAMQLLNVLRDLVLNSQERLNGYDTAGDAIGISGLANSVHMGQVCSRIDVAAFNAGYPMLATHMVRKPNGEINPSAFSDVWGPLVDECVNVALTHQWTAEQLDEVKVALIAMKPIGALAHWENIARRESQNPGFIRYNLHRKLKR